MTPPPCPGAPAMDGQIGWLFCSLGLLFCEYVVWSASWLFWGGWMSAPIYKLFGVSGRRKGKRLKNGPKGQTVICKTKRSC